MHKVILKKRILVTGILLITLFVFYYSFYRKKEKEDIYPDIINFNIAECEIDLERLADLESDTFWQNKSDYIKCPEFDYKDTKELGDFFTACCSVGFNKKLHGKITEVSMEWDIPEEGKNNFIYYWICNDQPFEGMYLEENGDGNCRMIWKGVTRNKTYEEIRQLAKKVVVHLNIQYVDGTKETKKITFGDELIDVRPYYDESYLSDYIVKKNNTTEE
ncbi:MAG: hypothetical protein HFI34_04345 [Lachnospiraceae bacterium]|nr:hypothetical protein [Lachnospiraceae bacterium]